MTIWKSINNYENIYQINNKGKIRKVSKNKILKPYKNIRGYLIIGLYKKNKRKRYLIHRLVAEAFIINKNNKLYVNHIDGNKINNNKDNLEWCTSRENQQHAYKIGLRISIKGTDHKTSKLKEKDVINIRKSYKEGKYNVRRMSKIYKVSRTNIYNIINYKRWKHI